jgi:glycosyltransferase involved in cell wall biosynthesis
MPSPHHVLYLIDQLWGLHGGAEGAFQRLIQLLPKTRYRCSVGTFRLYDCFPAHHLACPIHEFPIRRVMSLGTLRAAFELARFIRRERVDVVHTFFEASDVIGGLVARMAGCPKVISSRRDMGFRRTPLERLGYRLAAPCFDQVQTVSAAVRHEMIRADGLKPERVITIPNGIDFDSVTATNGYEALAHSFGLANRFPRIITVGNIRHVKGTDVFLRTAAEVVAHYPNAVFLVAGALYPGDFTVSVQHMVKELRLADHVRLLDGQSEHTIWSLLKACDVFCLLSRSEGMSNALLEAMACGLPSVATAVGGNPEVLEDGRTGYLVPSENHHAAATRILELLAHPERAAAIGQEARNTAEKTYSAQRMVDAIVSEYDRLLAARDRSAAIRNL